MKEIEKEVIYVSSTLVEFNSYSKLIKIKSGLDKFTLEQIRNFKVFDYDTLLIETEYYTLSIDKDKYSIRMYSNGTVTFTKK